MLRRQLKPFQISQEVEPRFVKIDKTESAIKDADSNLKEAERIVRKNLILVIPNGFGMFS